MMLSYSTTAAQENRRARGEKSKVYNGTVKNKLLFSTIKDQKHSKFKLTLQQDSVPVCKVKKAQVWCKANFPDMISSEE
ncbi:hypothetical protein TNCV_4957321 [Trichonephila clavipes]|nr:hypothetical protein TNCV_4957321 [Trichonephila clavipes]